MRCRFDSVLAAGIVPVLLWGCSSGLGPAQDAGSSTAGHAGTSAAQGSASNSGGAQSGGGSLLGSAGAGGAPGTGSEAGAPVIAGTPAGGSGGNVSSGGASPNTGGSRIGGSNSEASTGATAGVAGTSALGGAATAGMLSDMASGGATVMGGAVTGGSSAGGATTTGSNLSRPTFPARFVGNIDTRGVIRTDFPQYWDQFTPENAGKWPSVQMSSSSTFNWKSLDAMYKYADENNILFKEHCFIWGAGQPAWLNNNNAMEAAKAWMKAFCERYPKTRIIDVVNEPPPHTTPTYANGLGGGTRTTWDWIANSFKLAREACPNAILLLNDYNNCEYAKDVQNTIDIVSAIKKLDAPIDAIGCEGHYVEQITVSTFKSNIDKLTSETGLPVYITEYDINAADDEKQRAQYADHFTMLWDNPNVKGVTVWGYIVGATWRTNTGIMKSDGTMRPAMTWLMDFLKR